MTRTTTTLATLAALGLAAALPSGAHAQADLGTLSGAFYQAPDQSLNSLADAQSFLSANSPAGAFTSQQSTLQSAGYSGTDTSTPQQFLGADSASYTATGGSLSDGIFDLEGYLDVTTPGTYTFSTTSDDGSGLYIGGLNGSASPSLSSTGTQVVNNDGTHGSQTATGTQTFAAPGAYPVDLLYFNRATSDQSGGASLTADFGGLSVAASSDFPAPPSPGFAGPYDPSRFSASGASNDGGITETVTPGSGPAYAVDFAYKAGFLYSYGIDASADFTTTAAGTGLVTFAYSYSGYNAFHDAYSDAQVEDYTTGAAVDLGADGSAGRASLLVNSGDVFGFHLTGGNGDADSRSQNDLRVSEFVAPAPEPSAWAGLALGALGLAALALKTGVKARKRAPHGALS